MQESCGVREVNKLSPALSQECVGLSQSHRQHGKSTRKCASTVCTSLCTYLQPHPSLGDGSPLPEYDVTRLPVSLAFGQRGLFLPRMDDLSWSQLDLDWNGSNKTVRPTIQHTGCQV